MTSKNVKVLILSNTFSLQVSNYLNWIVRNSSELEMMMNAVERVDEYTKLEIETTTSGRSYKRRDKLP